VPLHFINAEVSPAVKDAGAIISHVMNEIDISCLPKDLPEFIAVDLSAIEVGHAVKVSDLTLGDGVSAVTHGKDPVVATAVVPRALVEAEETVAAADAVAAAAAPAADAKAADAKAGDAKGGDPKGGDKKDSPKDDKKK
jgi:large subunit ribosomal protein L25